MNRALMIGLIVIVVGALIGGFMVVGGPGYARLEKADLERARDLREISAFLQCRSVGQILPETLDDESYCPNHPRMAQTNDPVTGDPYVYRRLSDSKLEVCATFSTDAPKGDGDYNFRTLTFDGQVGCRSGVTLLPPSN